MTPAHSQNLTEEVLNMAKRRSSARARSLAAKRAWRTRKRKYGKDGVKG